MKREIKFRAWDKENKKMAQVSRINFGPGGIRYLVDDSVLLEYTGLHDKNGREIYEGDVLQCTSYTYGNGETGKTSLLVKYDEMSAGFIAGPYMLGKLMDIRKCEVIGNIFENKQLLEGKK